ncbi:MAG: DUF421 domain-containing protein [Gemmatimonadetes bacterium]|nr:DUF421 domain-containing protein [Gemmatimonadota bacterium]
MNSYWQDLFVSGVPLGEKILRTLAVYVFLLVSLRLAGKRELGQLNPYDLVVLLLLSNTVQNAIIGNDNSLLGGLTGAVTLLVLNYGVVRFLYRHPRLDRVVEGHSDLLIRHGQVVPHGMEKNQITLAELKAAARRQGISTLGDVDTCRLEVGGALTFVPKQPEADVLRHHELMEQIAELQRQVAALRPPASA